MEEETQEERDMRDLLYSLRMEEATQERDMRDLHKRDIRKETDIHERDIRKEKQRYE